MRRQPRWAPNEPLLRTRRRLRATRFASNTNAASSALADEAGEIGAKRIAERVAVLYAGRIVEEGPVGEVYARPAHPYTEALLAAAPVPDPGAEAGRRGPPIAGEPAGPAATAAGCAFAPRCPIAAARCLPGFLIRTDISHPVRLTPSTRTGRADGQITGLRDARRTTRDVRWFPRPSDCNREIDGGVS